MECDSKVLSDSANRKCLKKSPAFLERAAVPIAGPAGRQQLIKRMKDIRERELDGEMISTSDPEYHKIIDTITETMQLAHELNLSPKLISPENRELLAKIFGHPLDESTTILPPFYIDYGKNVTIGKNVWVQQGCTFFDRGGITIGDNVFLAPKVNLITLNHNPDPYDRSTTICKPIVIRDRVWIGIASTVLAGVTIGENSIIGANSVVTRDVPPNVIAAGNPARIIKKIDVDAGA